MTRPVQTAREALHVNEMVQALQLQLANTPVSNESPFPDFALALADGRRVGVEVTEATDPAVADAWNGLRARLETAIVRALEREAAKLDCVAYLHVEALLAL